MDSRDPLHLHPWLRALWHVLRDELSRAGHQVALHSTYRSAEVQDRLWRQGRQDPGPRVTNLRGGQSWHNVTSSDGTPAAAAFDFHWRTPGGGLPFASTHPWELAGVIGERLGLRWGGRWRPLADRPHLELPMTLAEAQATSVQPVPALVIINGTVHGLLKAAREAPGDVTDGAPGGKHYVNTWR